VLTTCQPSTVWCSRERLPAAAAQPAKFRQSCSATYYYYIINKNECKKEKHINLINPLNPGFNYMPSALRVSYSYAFHRGQSTIFREATSEYNETYLRNTFHKYLHEFVLWDTCVVIASALKDN
jgi:hypothetical protein